MQRTLLPARPGPVTTSFDAHVDEVLALVAEPTTAPHPTAPARPHLRILPPLPAGYQLAEPRDEIYDWAAEQ